MRKREIVYDSVNVRWCKCPQGNAFSICSYLSIQYPSLFFCARRDFFLSSGMSKISPSSCFREMEGTDVMRFTKRKREERREGKERDGRERLTLLIFSQSEIWTLKVYSVYAQRVKVINVSDGLSDYIDLPLYTLPWIITYFSFYSCLT